MTCYRRVFLPHFQGVVIHHQLCWHLAQHPRSISHSSASSVVWALLKISGYIPVCHLQVTVHRAQYGTLGQSTYTCHCRVAVLGSVQENSWAAERLPCLHRRVQIASQFHVPKAREVYSQIVGNGRQ